jgi:hypothetical protein
VSDRADTRRTHKGGAHELPLVDGLWVRSVAALAVLEFRALLGSVLQSDAILLRFEMAIPGLRTVREFWRVQSLSEAFLDSLGIGPPAKGHADSTQLLL